jgi:long-chain fatty acid transport protein
MDQQFHCRGKDMLAKIRKAGAWSVILFILSQGSAAADQYHYTNMLIGDRASGMAGAYAAVSDDTSGLYYNPAGAAYSTGRNLSASVNTYYNLTKKYDNVIGGNGWERKSSALLPNFFGVIQPVGKYKIGISYAVPDSVQEDQDQVFGNFPSSVAGVTVTSYVVNFNNDDTTYNFGPSFAMEVTRDFAVGATLYVHHRRNQLVLNQLVSLDTGQTEWTNRYEQVVERGYRPILGLMWSPMEKVSIGLAVSRTLLYGTSVQAQTTVKDTADVITLTAEGVDAKKKYPLQVRGGIAYFPSGSLLIALDGVYSAKVNDPVFGDKVSVLNGALGVEYYFNRKWAMRCGLYTDLANTPETQTGGVNQPERVNVYGGSASVSNFTRNTSVTLGASVSTGSGSAQIVGNDPSVQNVDTQGWMIFLSSTYSY